MKKVSYLFLIILFQLMVLTGKTYGNYITNVQLSPPSPAALAFNQHVDITFDYLTTEAGGVRIFVRPFTNGSLTPNYAAHPSPLYPAGSGSGTGFITIVSGPITVDQLRFQMYNSNQTALLLEFFIPVEYHFGIVTGLSSENNELEIPTQFQLLPNYPNPFNSITNIVFQIPKEEFVTLKIYNVLGEEVAMLVSGNLNAGKHRFDFNASDLPSGVYFYRLKAGEFDSIGRALLLK